jgi:hypothetical protein
MPTAAPARRKLHAVADAMAKNGVALGAERQPHADLMRSSEPSAG